MSADEFREMVLNFRGATESSHMGHPDFRANGKIFATLGSPDTSWGMVKLAPQDQKHFLERHPQMFVPAKGAWGLQGSTLVRLVAASPEVLYQAIDLAWQNSALTPKTAKKQKNPNQT